MKQYLDIVANVLNYGKNKQPVRKGADGKAVNVENGTIALANVIFSHNMDQGFPLLTTKKMPLRVIAVELEGFIKGITSKAWFQQRGCKIWNEWSNPQAAKDFYDKNYRIPYLAEQAHRKEDGWLDIDSNEPLPFESVRKGIQASVDDLGPIYGSQWRNFDGHYGELAGSEFMDCDMTNLNGSLQATDQLKGIVDTLHNAPYDRRMVCSAWNPNQIHMMALPPCHYAWNVTVIDDEINLAFIMRSVDTALGMPFNIASYGLLLSLLSKESGFKAGNLTGLFVDCHIYNNQIKAAYEQLQREPYKLPTLEILSKNDEFSIFDWEHTDLKLNNYQCHPKLDFGAVTV